jgi:hypothetical protein
MPGPVAPYSNERFAEWFTRHNAAPFSPQFNAMLVRMMCDPDVDGPSRFMAWLTLYAAGNHSDRPVHPNGREKSRADCSKETGMDRRRVSEAVQFCAARGWVILDEDRMTQWDGFSPLVPLCPDVSDKSEDVAKFGLFTTYWLDRRPATRLIHEQLQSTVAQAQAGLRSIQLEILQDWKRERETWVPPVADGEEVEKTELPADSDLSGTVGQLVRDVPDNVSATFRTNGAPIYRTVEALNKKSASAPEILKTGGPAAAADEGKTPPPIARSNPTKAKPETDEFEPVRDHLHSLDKTANDEQVEGLIRQCRDARRDIEPGLLLRVLQHLTQNKNLTRPFGFLNKHAAAFLRSRKAFEAWLANGTSTSPETPQEKEKREMKALLRSHAQNLKTSSA